MCVQPLSGPLSGCLAHSGSLSGFLWLSQALSGSPNLLTKPLLGSQGPCSARSVATALQHFNQPCSCALLNIWYITNAVRKKQPFSKINHS